MLLLGDVAGNPARLAAVDDQRRLRIYRGADGVQVVKVPIPGEASVLAVDPVGRPWALLEDGATFELSPRPPHVWLRHENLFTAGGTMKRSTNDKLVAAWPERVGGMRKVVALTSERRILILREGNAPRIGCSAPIPGTEAVMAVLVSSDLVTAVLADGSILGFTPRTGRWGRMGSMFEEGAEVSLRATQGFILSNDPRRVVERGQTFTVPHQRARELMALGYCAPVDVEGA